MGFRISRPVLKDKVISMLKDQNHLNKVCIVFLVSVILAEPTTQLMEELKIVCEISDVFLEELPRLPPHCEVEFSVDLMPETALISKVPYHMASTELEEQNKQL
jgi:hypothetical protein